MQDSYTTGEAARLCMMSQQSLIRYFDSGALRGFRVGRGNYRRVPHAELVRFMGERGIPLNLFDERPPWVSAAEACRILRRSRGALIKLVRAGKVATRARTDGLTSLLYSRADVERLAGGAPAQPEKAQSQ